MIEFKENSIWKDWGIDNLPELGEEFILYLDDDYSIDQYRLNKDIVNNNTISMFNSNSMNEEIWNGKDRIGLATIIKWCYLKELLEAKKDPEPTELKDLLIKIREDHLNYRVGLPSRIQKEHILLINQVLGIANEN